MLANTLHSSALTLPIHKSPGGLNWSHQCNSSTHLLAPSTGNLPAQGSQWWAPSERARSHIQAVGEWSVSQGTSNSLCMREAVRWGQSLWRKLAFPTIKKVDGLPSGERPHTHAGLGVAMSPVGSLEKRQKWSLAWIAECLLQYVWD